MSTNNLKRFVLAMAAVVVATACSSGDNEVKYRYPDYESFCQGRAEAECGDDAVKHCSTSKEGCIAGRRKYCLALQEEKATYQPQHAEKCIDAAGKVFTDGKFTIEERTLLETECFLLWGGSRQHGEQCSRDYDCNVSDGLRCVKASPGAPGGHCFSPVEVAVGASCKAEGSVCVAGTFCKSGDCVNKRGAGDQCNEDEPCGDAFRCLPPEGEKRACESKAPTGAICSSDDECISGFCVKAGPSKTCADDVPLGRNEPICESFHQPTSN